MAVECEEASQLCGCHLRARCLSSSHQAVSEEKEGRETVRASLRKTGCLLKSQTGGNKERKKKKKKKPRQAIANLWSESRQKIALVCRASLKRQPLLAFKVPLKRKLSSLHCLTNQVGLGGAPAQVPRRGSAG